MSQADLDMMIENTKNEIESLDIQSSPGGNLQKYLNTKRVKFSSYDEACKVYYAAKQRMITDLMEKCFEYLSEFMIPPNVFKAIECADLCEDFDLKDLALFTLYNNSELCLRTAEFEEISESMLLNLVKVYALDLREVVLFKAVKRWAVKECSRRNIDPNKLNMRLVLDKVIPHIRFLTMSFWEFAREVGRSRILTFEEAFAIYRILDSNNMELPMPAHLSSCTQSRDACPHPWLGCSSDPVSDSDSVKEPEAEKEMMVSTHTFKIVPNDPSDETRPVKKMRTA